jgi:hypothetical protein
LKQKKMDNFMAGPPTIAVTIANTAAATAVILTAAVTVAATISAATATATATATAATTCHPDHHSYCQFLPTPATLEEDNRSCFKEQVASTVATAVIY